MPNTPPKESAVRSALRVIEAAEVLATGNTEHLANEVGAIMAEAKKLRPDQLADIQRYLAGRYGGPQDHEADDKGSPELPTA